MKKIKLYKIKNSFANAFQDEKIKVFLELFTRATENDFCKEQLSLIVECFDKERLNELILTKFENRKDFTIMENGYNLVNVVTETEEDAKDAINYLKRNNLGRATFLPLTAIRGDELREKGVEDECGCVGLASRLVQFDGKYQNILLFH